MQQFTVPQFIDVEDKIFGPITTRQFIIFLGGAVVIAISYKLFDQSLFLTIAIAVFLIATSFAFVKINGRPFHLFVLNMLQTLRRPGLRIWNNRDLSGVEDSPAPIVPASSQPASPKFYKKSRLAELALVVDTKGRYRGE
jgi:hypothetical protein